jgi:hypothetical protein
LWGCAFEDFLTHEFGPDRENIVETYLKRRGWNERPQSKIYMKAMRSAVMSLYEVSGVVPGKSFRARDIIRGGEPVIVSEASATLGLKQWDKLATRIVEVGKKTVMSGGTLLFPHEALDEFWRTIENKAGDNCSDAKPISSDAFVRSLAPLIVGVWIIDAVRKTTGENAPILVNSEGEEILFHTVRYPLRAGVSQAEVGDCLDNVADLRPESDVFWNWLGGPGPVRAAKRENAQALITTMDDGSLVLGNVDLDDEFVKLSVNSAGRALKGRALLEQALGELVGEPLTEIRTVEQMRASAPSHESSDFIPPEDAVSIVHEMLDTQYLEILEEPIPMLGDISPRAAISTEKGRRKVVEWLKYLENRAANTPNPNDPMATYDFGWMWDELKLKKLRK